MAVLDVPTLRRALEATGVNAHRIPQTITRLMRPWEGGRPRGLAAFLIVLKESRAALDRRAGTVSKQRYDDLRHLEAVAQLLRLDRSTGKEQSAKIFAAKCSAFGLGPTASHIAKDPQMFRYAVMLTRIERQRTRVPD